MRVYEFMNLFDFQFIFFKSHFLIINRNQKITLNNMYIKKRKKIIIIKIDGIPKPCYNMFIKL